jgi:hypothetical protein
MGRSSRMMSLFAVFALVCGMVLESPIPAQVQGEEGEGAALFSAAPAVVRTLEDMQHDEATQGQAAAVVDVISFRPTMDAAEYLVAKAAAELDPMSVKPEAQGPSPQAPPGLISNFNGASQAGLIPPDTHGAVGLDHFVEVTNSQRTVLSKSTGAILSNVSLASFFGYFAQTLFDPRVVYDPMWNRWVIIADARPESATVQRLFIAVSVTSNPLGAFFVYSLDVNINNNDDFFDFPQLGMDLRSIIITANIFGPASFREARLFPIAKALLYNGLGISFPIFRNLPGTLAPPLVRTAEPWDTAFIARAPNNGNAIQLFALTNSDVPALAALTARPNVPVTAYALPPDAPQPAPCTAATNRLDTSDNRFVNACTQVKVGAVISLFCAHTVQLGSFATVRWYEFNAANSTLIRFDTVFKSGTSHDFNPSITANDARDMVVTWSATDPPFGAAGNAQVRFGGRRSVDPTDIGAGAACFTSPACITGNFDPNFGVQRWGDYSAVTVDPRNALRFWLVNENINSASAWGSRTCQTGF